MARRIQASGNKRYTNGFQLTLQQDKLDDPKHWRKPRLVFVNSMSDLFHKDVPLDFQKQVFETMNAYPQHKFQVLTKRSSELVRLVSNFNWTENIWMGVTVEDQNNIHRIDDLKKVPAKVRFLSLEPLLGPLPNLDLDGIHWVIVGGESGPRFRAMDPDWARDIRNQCIAAKVKFHFKQYAAFHKKKLGCKLDGIEWKQFPN